MEQRNKFKPEVIIDQWEIVDNRLHGIVLNHPRFEKGTRVVTSSIVTRQGGDQVGDKVETKNTIYLLGKKA